MLMGHIQEMISISLYQVVGLSNQGICFTNLGGAFLNALTMPAVPVPAR